jgi:hypothetical protein
VTRTGYLPPAPILRVNARLRDVAYTLIPASAILLPHIRDIRSMTEHDINRSFELALVMLAEESHGTTE